MLQEGIQADLSEGQKSRAAIKQVLLGQTYVQLGQRAPAIAAAEEAVRAPKDADVLHLAARVLVEAGKAAGAQEIGQMLSHKLDSEPQSFGRLIAGEIALKKGDIQEAIRQMRESRKLVDTWIGHFDLGRAYLAADAFTDADGEFDTCIRRRGEAASLPLDLLPTYSYLPAAYYYAGRAQAEIGSAGAVDLFKTFLSLRSKAATTDPMVLDAKKRTAVLSK